MQRILVPTDLTDRSLEAVGIAQMLAHQFGSSVHLLYVVDPVRREGVPLARRGNLQGVDDQISHAAEQLRKLVYWKLNQSGNVIPVVRYGKPPAEIVRYASDHEMDLIVMTTRGGSTVSGGLMGSATAEVIRASPVPVLAVRAGTAAGCHEDASEEEHDTELSFP